MQKRFVSIWFHHLVTDWFIHRKPELSKLPFVIAAPSHGRLVIKATNPLAEAQGIHPGMVAADARALIPSLEVLNHQAGLEKKLLHKIAEWCIRFSPVAAVDGDDGLLLEATGCTHLWEGDYAYVGAIVQRLKDRGYQVRASIADTIGAAWALARYGKESLVIPPGYTFDALLPLPPASLRLEQPTVDRLHKLGLSRIRDFIKMPGSTLRRRFGQPMIDRLGQALGTSEEILEPVIPATPYQERLPCLEPISTATGIEYGLKRLLQALCERLQHENKGLRTALFKSYKVDGTIITLEIGTSRPSHHPAHLFRLFEEKITTIRPDLGIELFTLDALKVEEHAPVQESIWETGRGLQDPRLAELIDRMNGRFGDGHVKRYVPAEHHWPEWSIRESSALHEKPSIEWKLDRPRPIQLLSNPERIEVTAPIPDYPPMLFRRNKKLYKIAKADGPERIEQEWWLQQGEHRDYYCVEDTEGNRYWLFRSGHYAGDNSPDWFIHGFFA